MHVCVPRWEDPKLPTNSRRIEENVLLFEGVGEGEEAREENGWVGGRGERSKIGECLSFGIYSVQ